VLRAAWGTPHTKSSLNSLPKSLPSTTSFTPTSSQLQRDMINRFGSAKDQWFSSFMLSVEAHSSWHRLFVDPLSRAMYSSSGADFEYITQRKRAGVSIHDAVYELACRNFPMKWQTWRPGWP
jgi:conjugal transfer ATP-binding protein TraC